MHTFWVTFYSYKGGVGRSMALANVAADLVANGRRVVMIDFDLEAPGLDAFEELDLQPGAPGLVEYVSEYLATEIAPPISGFVQEVTHKMARRGKLWVIHAGRKDEEYNRLRAAINWEDLYDNRDGAEFLENFKADIEQQFQPDYVFVDSRTGLTDVGGVCTLHLPDLVVLLFSLNEQNLQGVSSVARVLRNADTSPLLLPVATPVPSLPRDKGLLKERFQRAKELVGLEIKHSISYSALVSLKEQIITWSAPQRLQGEYQELAQAIQNANPQGLDYLLREAESAMDNLEFDRAQEICAALESEYPDRPDAWLKISEGRRLDKDSKGYESALRTALELDPNGIQVFRRLETLLVSQKRDLEVLSLAEKLLEQDGNLDDANKKSIEGTIAEICMRLGKYAKALDGYGKVLTLSKSQDNDFENLEQLGPLFNVLEARRRVGEGVSVEDWRRLVKLYEASAAGAGSTGIGTLLNQMQAMHIAYALAENISEAESMLQEVIRLAESASPRERIFSVASYSYISRNEFFEINNQMLQALAKGELWDGFKLR